MKTTRINPFSNLKFLAVLLAAGLVLWGCDQGVPSTTHQNATAKNETAAVNSSPSSVGIAGKTGAERHEARDKLEETAQILATLAPNSKMFTSIRKALKVRRKRGYREDVSFAHLFKGSPEAASGKARAKYASTSRAFRNGLHASLKKTGAAMSKELQAFLVQNGVTVAWPYREHFNNLSPRPTITFHPLTNKAENGDDITVTGFKPVKGNGGTQYKEVEVNEAYVKENPTLIIRPCEVGPVSADYMTNYCSLREEGGHIMATSSDGSDSGSGASTNAMKIEEPGTGGGGGGGGDSGDGDGSSHPEIGPEDMLEMELASVQCNYDTDNWMSGGPDLNFRLVEPKVNDAGEVVRDELGHAHVDFSGDQCDNNDVMYVNTNWDGRWERMDKTVGVVVWDSDTFHSSGTVNVDVVAEPKYSSKYVGVSGTVTVNASLSYDSSEPKWHRGTYARAMFTGNPQPNWENCDNGTRNGKCIQGLGSNGNMTLDGILLEDR